MVPRALDEARWAGRKQLTRRGANPVSAANGAGRRMMTGGMARRWLARPGSPWRDLPAKLSELAQRLHPLVALGAAGPPPRPGELSGGRHRYASAATTPTGG